MRFFVATQSQLLLAFSIIVLAICALVPLVWLIGRFFGESLQKEEAASGEMICRNCKCKTVRSSFQAGIVDHSLGLFGLVPFRCEVCYWRFYARRPAARPSPSSAR